MTDEEWVELGRIPDDAGYIAAFGAAFGIDISTGSTAAPAFVRSLVEVGVVVV